jgi:hypothetical protein
MKFEAYLVSELWNFETLEYNRMAIWKFKIRYGRIARTLRPLFVLTSQIFAQSVQALFIYVHNIFSIALRLAVVLSSSYCVWPVATASESRPPWRHCRALTTELHTASQYHKYYIVLNMTTIYYYNIKTTLSIDYRAKYKFTVLFRKNDWWTDIGRRFKFAHRP